MLNKLIKNNIYLIIFQIILMFFIELTCSVHGISLLFGLKLFLFEIFGLFLPGLLITDIIKLDINNSIEKTAWSYFFGFVLVIIEYVVLMLLKISNYSYLLLVIQAIFVCYFLIKKRNCDIICCIEKDWIICIVFVVLLNIYCILSTSLNNTLPTISTDTFYNLDFLFWTGNNISFTKGLPVQNYRLVGYPFYYHYFSSIIISQISFFIKENVVLISLLFSSIIPTCFMVLTSYSLLNKFTNRKVLLSLGMLGILFSESNYYGFLIGHLYDCPFGFDYAYGLGMLAISYLVDIYRNNNYTYKELIVSSIIVAICTGFKGPVVVVILFGYAIITLHLLLSREIKKGLLFGFVWVISFLFIYVFFVSMTLCDINYSGNELEFVGLLSGFNENIGPINQYILLRNKYNLNDSKILKIISIILYLLKQSILSFISTGLAFVYCLIKLLKKQKIDTLLFVLFGIYIWGVLLFLNTHQEGNSQLYFLMATIPYGVSGGIYLFSKNDINKCFSLIVVSVCVFMNFYNAITYHAIERVSNGVNTYNGKRIETINRDVALDGHVNINDYIVANWLNNNIEEDAIIAIDYFEYDNYKNRQIMGIFSNRFVWNDGEYAPFPNEVIRRQSIICEIINNEFDIRRLKKEEGVGYFIRTPSGYDDYSFENEKAEIVYQEYGYTVYRIK